ncbi:slit homolog 1 protein-like [Abrus precatorius]|uniref:Slit homolog 1 protein-like n=1 Tax=Abrus precatorius TaxID=3816 RepID=A0A8B8KLV5_ABRPR|nr:slit homolog 1 protein-like [Abrus precatorius]
MGMFSWTSITFVSLHLLFTSNVSATSTQLSSNPTQDDIGLCNTVFCGKGTCHPSTDFIGYRCDCDSGWKKFNIGPLELPPCIIPNCTFDYNCGDGSVPPPQVPPPNVSDPCSLSLCGDGTCVRNGSDFTCQCNEGSANLLNDPKMICFKKCTLGPDCDGLDLGLTPPSTQGSGSSSPKTGNCL